MSTQQAIGRCDHCGAAFTFTPDERSPWEFHYRCGCGFAGTVSWAHRNPPPEFRGEPTQGGLFDAGDALATVGA